MTTNRIDDHKLIYHPDRVAQWQESGDCFPIYVELGLTNRCNHNCIFCALDWLTEKSHDIDRDVLLSALKDMAEHGVKSIMFAGEGEATLHNDLALFAQFARKNGIQVALTTNGVPFGRQKAQDALPFLSWIRFSVNAGTPETYAKVHNTISEDFERVLANITYAAKIKTEQNLHVDIGVQALIIPESINDIEQLASRVRKSGADNLQIKPYSQHPLSKNKFTIDYNQYLTMEQKLKAFETDTFKVIFRKNTINRLLSGADYTICHGLPFFALINAKGQIIPCNLFYNDPHFIYGDLYKNSFTSIWTGEQRKKVIKALAKKETKECRQICRLDPINRYLNRIKNPEERDVFI